ncbi:transporter substrate-binding domain-containing protein [Methanoculleus frigidifontis]|nr:transporter substrate-binding domain-containing protein [Methanoculleus sp. FWC-SCC1]
MKHTLLLLVGLCILGCLFCPGCTTSSSTSTGAEPESIGDVSLNLYAQDFPPYSFVDEDGAVTGQSTEIAREIARRLNENVTIEVAPWAEGYRAALSEPDTGLYPIVRTAEREPLFLWAGPIGTYEYVFYAKNGSAISAVSLDAVRKAGAVGVVQDDVRHQYLVENGVTNLALYADDTAAVRALMNGTVDLWLGSSNTASETALAAGIDPASLMPVYPVKEDELYIAFNNRTPAAVVEAWQATLSAMKRDGSYDAILAEYQGEKTGTGNLPAYSGTLEVPGEVVLASMIAYTDQRLSCIARVFEALATTDEVRSADWERIAPLLSEAEKVDSSARLWYSLPNGTYYTTVDGLAASNLMSRPYFPDVLAGNVSIGTVVVSHSTGRSTAIVAVPVVEEGAVTGVLGASVYLDEFSVEMREALDIHEPFFFFALDLQGAYALHAEEARISQSSAQEDSASAAEAMATIRAENEGTVTYTSEGEQRQVIFATSPLTGWRFGLGEIAGA